MLRAIRDLLTPLLPQQHAQPPRRPRQTRQDHARMVSASAAVATSPSALRPTRWPISREPRSVCIRAAGLGNQILILQKQSLLHDPTMYAKMLAPIIFPLPAIAYLRPVIEATPRWINARSCRSFSFFRRTGVCIGLLDSFRVVLE